MNKRQTVHAKDSVMLNWQVTVPEELRRHDIIAACCMVPQRQLELIEQCLTPKIILSDSMDKWIHRQPELLGRVISQSHITMMNEDEALAYAGTSHLNDAGRHLLDQGAPYAIIKQGSQGSTLFSHTEAPFHCPAFPIKRLTDPTGAGDSFLGGMAGFLSTLPHQPKAKDIKEAIIHATAIASSTCESFSATSLFDLNAEQYNHRVHVLKENLPHMPDIIPACLDC